MGFLAISNPGLIRDHNEDAYLTERIEQAYLMIVCDGLGGHNAGEIASSMAIDTILGYIKSHADMADRQHLLELAIQQANVEIYIHSKKEEHLYGMGTTLVMAWIEHNHGILANVGDSRAYLQRRDQLRQVTRDHSLVEDLLESGSITKEEAEHFTGKNVITRALGLEKDINVDFWNLNLEPQDVILLCSDGLTDECSGGEIENIMNGRKGLALSEIINRLIQQANDNGGSDNITVALYRHEEVQA